jgi:hypothetical protein
VPGTHSRDLARRTGHLAGYPPDRRDQLGDRVLGGHRISQDRRVHRPAPPARQHSRLPGHLLDRVVDPVLPPGHLLFLSAIGMTWGGGTCTRWCSRPAGQRGSTVTARTPVRSLRLCSPRRCARLWACRSVSMAGCGASWPWGPCGRSCCRRTPRRGWSASPSWSRSRSRTRRRVELRGFAEEQAALRRVATLVARAAPPEQVFAAVAAEVGRVLDTDFTLSQPVRPGRRGRGGRRMERHRCYGTRPSRHPGEPRRAERGFVGAEDRPVSAPR